MDYTERRNRRRRTRSRAPHFAPHPQVHYVQRPTCRVFDSFCKFIIMASLIAIIYLMLDYHCKVCSKKSDVQNITKSINDISVNISRLKESYTDLEKSVMKFSKDIPNIEGQVEILGALARTMEKGDYIWNPKIHLPLPNVDVILKETGLVIPEPPFQQQQQYYNMKKNVTDIAFQSSD